MWPLPVVVTHIDAKDLLELSAVEDEEPVEALAPDGADPALDVRVCVRCPHRCSDHLDPVAAEDGVEGAAELAIAVVDQQPGPLAAVVEVHQQVARLLPMQMKTSTYSRRSNTVSTVRKSQASVVAACWRRNDRQSSRSRSGAGGTPAACRMLRTRVAETSMPSLRSSPAIRR